MLAIISAADQRRKRWKSKVKALPPRLAWKSDKWQAGSHVVEKGAIEKE